MTAYVVTYDLYKPGQNYTDLIKYLESFPSHWHIMQSVWIIDCNYTAFQLAEKIIQFLDRNDKLLVDELVENSAWYGFDEKGTKWLQSRLSVATT